MIHVTVSHHIRLARVRHFEKGRFSPRYWAIVHDAPPDAGMNEKSSYAMTILAEPGPFYLPAVRSRAVRRASDVDWFWTEEI